MNKFIMLLLLLLGCNERPPEPSSAEIDQAIANLEKSVRRFQEDVCDFVYFEEKELKAELIDKCLADLRSGKSHKKIEKN